MTDFERVAEDRHKRLDWIAQIQAVDISTTKPMPKVGDQQLRRLYRTEVWTLKTKCGCTSPNWRRILLMGNDMTKDYSKYLLTHVRDTTLLDTVLIVSEAAEGGGLFENIMVTDCIVDLSANVRRNGMLQQTYIGPGAAVLNCGSLMAAHETDYHTLSITVGAERGGGRGLALTAEATMIDVARQLMEEKADELKSKKSNMNVISAGCMVRDTPTIESVYLDTKASIVAATSVKKAVLFPGASIRNGCTVSNVRMQWQTAVLDHSVVTDSLLMEATDVGPKSIVADTVLGPDVHVSAGEVHASVVGPNTNAHHQSLLIGVLWLLGRGNVGYGANVGSNHTGRLPDQECLAGEGTFWGLSTVIKFPVNLAAAPYSIVAAGTNLSSQVVRLPFSLLVPYEDGQTQIVPGWVLRSSPYTLARSEQKFASRRKAERHDYAGWEILRPGTVDACRWARDELRRLRKEGTPIKQIDSCVLTEKNRKMGIQAYNTTIRRYALSGLLEFLQGDYDLNEFDAVKPMPVARTQAPWDALPWKDPDRWTHQKAVLLSEFPRVLSEDTKSSPWQVWVRDCLLECVKAEKDHAKRVLQCKERDDARGEATIPSYRATHVDAADDPVVQKVQQDAAATIERVQDLLEGPFQSLSLPSNL